MASLLLIGGTGFFGKSFLDSFQRGALDPWGIDHVIALSRHATLLKKIAPQLIDRRVELVNADIGTVDALPIADYIIHAAASTDLRSYLSRPEAERENLQSGVYNYCRLAPKYHQNSKIVYVSSGAVYGVQPLDVHYLEEDNVAISIDNMPEGKREYAMAKRDAEKAIRNICEKSDIKASIARCFAFVGPWLPRDQHFAIGNFIQDGLDGRAITVRAKHQVYRSYMYADDLVEWLMTLAVNADTSCQVYNVGSDTAVSIEELAKLIANIFGVPINLPVYSCGDKFDKYIPSIRKAKTMFGLDVRYGINDAVTRTLKSLV